MKPLYGALVGVLGVLLFAPAIRAAAEQTFDWGSISVTVESARLLDDGVIEVYLSFINKSGDPVWVIPGRNARASDDLKNEYRWTDSVGFHRSVNDLRAGNDSHNKFLKLDPTVPAPASFRFQRLGREKVEGKRPAKVFFAADLTIVNDIKRRTHQDRSISVASLKLE